MRRLVWQLLMVLAALGGTGSTRAAVQAVDDRGVTVVLPAPPQRIVSMLPSLTEVVCELGACARLVGVDTFSNWPQPVRRLAHVGGLEDANIEAIVALKPDLVLLATSSRALARLEGLGIPVAALEPRSFADVRRVSGQLAKLLGSGDAAALWARIDAGVDAAARELAPSQRGLRVYFEVNSAPYAAGESSFIGELLQRLGQANVVPAALGPFPKLNPEFVVRADPQVIMVSDRQAQAIGQRPGWHRIRAVRDGRVCVFTAEQGDVLVRAGPRMAEAAQLMVQCLQGRLRGRAP
jgi:iron complex transport system substrate-binding protein